MNDKTNQNKPTQPCATCGGNGKIHTAYSANIKVHENSPLIDCPICKGTGKAPSPVMNASNFMQVIPNSRGCVNGHKGTHEELSYPYRTLCSEKRCEFFYGWAKFEVRDIPEQINFRSAKTSDVQPAPSQEPELPGFDRAIAQADRASQLLNEALEIGSEEPQSAAESWDDARDVDHTEKMPAPPKPLSNDGDIMSVNVSPSTDKPTPLDGEELERPRQAIYDILNYHYFGLCRDQPCKGVVSIESLIQQGHDEGYKEGQRDTANDIKNSLIEAFPDIDMARVINVLMGDAPKELQDEEGGKK